METTNINIRVDKDVKADAEAISSALGMTLSTAVNIFLRKMIACDGMPFDVRLTPNETTIAAMREADDILSGRVQTKKYHSAQELFADLDAEDDYADT